MNTQRSAAVIERLCCSSKTRGSSVLDASWFRTSLCQRRPRRRPAEEDGFLENFAEHLTKAISAG
jgi:hypothetical protein